jgi:hypothetical protein
MTEHRHTQVRWFLLILAAILGALPGGVTIGATPEEDPIAVARSAVEAAPEDADARIALAGKLAAAMQADPSAGPRYAFELLETLKKAVEIDPKRTDAYQYLVGYYLNAPPIAGGSVERAEEAARTVAGYDEEAGAALLGLVEAHRARN